MSFNDVTTRVVQYFEDPKESKALAEIKRLSNLSKNKSSKNLIYIDQNKDKFDSNTEKNTLLNQNLSKENNDNDNNFKRRKHQFATQKYEQSISKEIKRKANLKNWNELLNNDEDGIVREKKNKNKNVEKHVNFTLNNRKTEENAKDKQKKDNDNINTPANINQNNQEYNRTRKGSSDNIESTTKRIVRYLEDPKTSNALAEIKRISNQAKKNKTSKNLVYINPDDLSFQKVKEKEIKEKNTIQSSYKRRKFQFATTVYVPKKENMTLIDELNKYKNIGIKKNEQQQSEDVESEDSIFNLDKNNKNEETKENKENNVNPIEIKDNIDKGRQLLIEKYRNNEPKKERNKYSSNTLDVSETRSYNNRKKGKYFNLRLPNNKIDTIDEEYKKNNNLIVENVNNKEKIIKNEYPNKNPKKKMLKTYKTEYFWDKMINRLVERRIYEDEKEPSKNINNKYNNNTFNPFNKYKNGYDTKEKENNITKEKIELNDIKDNPKEKEKNNVVYSRKYKYMPHLYTSNTLKVNKPVLNVDKEKNEQEKEQNEIEKPNYRIYQKRQIKKVDENEKKILMKMPTSNTRFNSGKNKKNEENKFNKVVQPYSNNINYTKNKKTRFNMLLAEKNVFKEDEDLPRNNSNSVYSRYMQKQKTTITFNRTNSGLIEDLKKIERYSIKNYLKNDLLEIYDNINDEFKDFKNGVFNTNLNDFETKMGEFDKNKNTKRTKNFNVNDLWKGKPITTDDIYKKYKKRAIVIEKEIYNY